MSKLYVFDIFWEILNKMKDNLSQECVKGEFLFFHCKIGTIVPDFPGKITVFSVLTPLFRLPLSKIWLSHPHKNYIFEIINNRAIR